MKKHIASVLAFCSFVGTAYAGMEAATGVNGSVHDMNKIAPAYGDSMDRVCVFCHTPHHAVHENMGLQDNPLWSHEQTLQRFEPYRWTAFSNYGPTSSEFIIYDPLVGPSRLCMSCHDGTIAIDQHAGSVTQPGVTIIDARAILGTDLTNDHPIGFNYVDIRLHRNTTGGVRDPTTGDSELVDPKNGFATAVLLSETPGRYNTVIRAQLGRKINEVLYLGAIMTCASCHEVHNKENVIQESWNATNPFGAAQTTRAPNYLLYAKVRGSLICLSCHIK